MVIVLQEFATDLRYAFRMLRKAPFASLTIILCLGYGIGGTGTVYAWTESLLFDPVPVVRDPNRLVSLRTVTTRGDANLSYPNLKDIRDDEAAVPAASRTFQSIAAFSIRRFGLRTEAATEERSAEPIWGELATANYFDVLGVSPVIGRGFAAGEDSTATPVVVISYGLWKRKFAGSPDVRGKVVWINNRQMTIIGVAPEHFNGTISRLALDVWMPISMQTEVAGNPYLLQERGVRWLDTFARLAPGVELPAANARAQTLGARLAANYVEMKDLGLRARTLDVGPVERVAAVFIVLLGISGLVVLIVCSNVANLLLLRGAAREHEMAVRVALGARPDRLVRQLMTECLLLAVGGIIVATAYVAVMRNALSSMAPASPLPLVITTDFDLSVFVVLVAVGLGTVFIFGLMPALRSARAAVRGSMAGGSRGGTSRGAKVRGALVSAQFALSLTVLVIAGLFIRRLGDLRSVDRGFHSAEQVMLSSVDFEAAGIRGDSTERILTDRIVERVRALPGVRSAASATFVPLGFLGYQSTTVAVDGYAPQPGEPMTFLYNRVTDGYFDTMGVTVVHGRGVEARDTRDAEGVAVVNQAFAARFWPGADALGHRIQLNGRALTVVGVVADGKYEFTAPLDQPSPPFLYVSYAQWGGYTLFIHARVDPPRDPLQLFAGIQRAVLDVDSRLSTTSPSTLEAYSSVPYLPIGLASSVLTIMGFAALILATLGLYAVIGYAVAQQQKEIGIRMALGATQGLVVRRFLGYAARYAGAGALVGTVLATLIARLLASKLPGSVPPQLGDRVVPFVLAALALGTVAAIAAIIPANRAARVSPTVALRED